MPVEKTCKLELTVFIENPNHEIGLLGLKWYVCQTMAKMVISFAYQFEETFETVFLWELPNTKILFVKIWRTLFAVLAYRATFEEFPDQMGVSTPSNTPNFRILRRIHKSTGNLGSVMLVVTIWFRISTNPAITSIEGPQ